MSKPRILWVDDDPNIIAASQRYLRKQYTVYSAGNAHEGLVCIEEHGPFAVIISDFKMPGVDGIEFLSQAHTVSPESTRIMLTGFADQEAAIQAVNRGHIFRFLTKPCPPDQILEAIEAAARQYELLMAEQVLLEKTLLGSLRVMTELLALVHPVAFRHTQVIEQIVTGIALSLEIDEAWKAQAAVILSQLGYASVPEKVLLKHFSGEALSDDESAMIEACPKISQDLIARIPRLEDVVEIISLRTDSKNDHRLKDKHSTAFKAHLLHTAIDYDRMRSRGHAHDKVIKVLRFSDSDYAPQVVSELSQLNLDRGTSERLRLPIEDLKNGMIIDEDIVTTEGIMLIPHGLEINRTIRQRLMNFHKQGEVGDSFWVLIPLAQNLPQAGEPLPSGV